MVPSVFQQIAVLDATRTSRLTGPTAQTSIQMFDRRAFEFDSIILKGPHQIDSTAGRIILITGFEIGGTRGKTEPAVNAAQSLCLVEKLFLRRNQIIPSLATNSRPSRQSLSSSIPWLLMVLSAIDYLQVNGIGGNTPSGSKSAFRRTSNGDGFLAGAGLSA